MKISKTFRLSEEAVEVLSRQDTPTQFVEDLILGQATQSLNIQYVTKEEVIALIEERVGGMQTETLKAVERVPISDLKIEGVTTGDQFVPKPPDPETGYACCTRNTPCKHWQWSAEKTCYINTLTGKEREVQ